jgi:hypothetical protein
MPLVGATNWAGGLELATRLVVRESIASPAS